jgi:hypothetical protein
MLSIEARRPPGGGLTPSSGVCGTQVSHAFGWEIRADLVPPTRRDDSLITVPVETIYRERDDQIDH